jgi:transposase
MENTLPQAIAPSELAPVNGNGVTPFSQQTVVLTKQVYIELTWQANDWRVQHARLVEREAALKAAVAALQATIRALTQRLYGTKSEQSTGPDGAGASKPTSPRKRGQQPGSRGHGRSERSALPVVVDVHDFSETATHGPACGAAFVPFPGRAASTLLAVQVQAHRRRIPRQRYHTTGQCPHVPGIVTAPPAPRRIPKSPLGVSVWTRVLLDQDRYGRPTHRCCEEWRHPGLPVAQGTLTDGLHRIAALFEPMMSARHARQMGAQLFHGDETRWEVCEEVDGKTGHRWSLWVRRSASVVCSRMAPGRGAAGPQAHVAALHRDLVPVVLVCERYSASTGLAKSCDEFILAYCWAHVRRDVLKAARRWPELDSGMWAWIDDSRDLYRVNAARLEAWDDTLPLDQHPAAFVERHGELTSHLNQMQTRCAGHLETKDLPLAQAKVLTSLHNHGDGLPVFVERPEVARDNNAAERALRTPVVGRKHSDGSGSVWSAHLAAMMLSVRQTVLLWGLTPHHGLTACFQACADHGGKSPTDLSVFLPWPMTPERREELARPVPVTLPPVAGVSQELGEPAMADTS